jgi:hypothetical protein
MPHCRGATLVVFLVFLLVPRAATAGTTTVNFDNLAAGTVLGTQYQSQGVILGQGPHHNTLISKVLDVGAAAHSAPNVASIATCGEIPTVDGLGTFTGGRHEVSVYVGDPQFGSGQLTLTGYDQNSQPIAGASDTAQVPGDGHVGTLLSISDPNGNIWYFSLTAATSGFVCPAMDDLTFDVPAVPPPPDFGFDAQNTNVTVAAGTSVSVPVALNRLAGSTGPISLSTGGAPSGVTATVSPNPDSGGDGSSITLTLTAAANAPPTTNGSITLTGTPSAMAGTVPRSAMIPISVSGNFDLRAQGIDVTQAIQTNGLLIPSGADSGGSYNGVTLFSYTDTVARVYADAHGAPNGVAGVQVVLHAYRNGVELADSPLMPDYGPAVLPDTGEADPAPVFPAERTSDSNAFTFVIPWDWTTGTITLTADVSQPLPSLGGGPRALECTSPACQANNSFTLKNVTFVQPPAIDISTVEIAKVGDAPLPSPDTVFAAARTLTAGGAGIAVYPYTTELELDNQLLATLGSDLNTGYGNLLMQWADGLTSCELDCIRYGLPQDFVIGVTTDQRGVTMGGWNLSNLPLFNPAGGQDAHLGIAVVNPTRPLTSVAHELGHLIGRNHADVPQQPPGCGGNGGPWPPDGKGYIEGIGLDPRTSPFKIIAPGLPGEPAQWYDWMSYCANINESTGGGNVPDAWISDRNWEADATDELAFGQRQLAGGEFGQNVARRRPSALASHPGQAMLTVLATGATNGVSFFTVLPGRSLRPPIGAPSPYMLTARDSSGHVLSTVTMSGSIGHADQPKPELFDTLEAQVPARAVHSLAISTGGRVLATRVRPAHPPRLKLLAPRASQVVGGRRRVAIRWRATDPEHSPLTIFVDYTPDGGRRWRTVYGGANRGRTTLPAFFFARSRDARLRVRADDGFNETQALSSRFTVLAPPPQVTITSPATRSHVVEGDILNLRGAAFDSTPRPLTGASLQWMFGRTLLGRGTATTVRDLPPGTDRISLIARARSGATGSASIVVFVRPAHLSFLATNIPKRISRRTRRLTLHLRAALPMSIRIGRRTFKLTAGARTISLPIARARTPILTTLWVTVGGATQPLTFKTVRV